MLAMNKKANLNVVGPEGTQIRVSAVPLAETGDYGKPVILMEGVLPEESDWCELPAENTTSLKGEKVPALQILDAYPPVSGLEMSMMLSDYCMGWGIWEV